MNGKWSVLVFALVLGTLMISGCERVKEIRDSAPDAGSAREIRGSGNVVTEDRPVSDFDRVSLTGAGDVIISQGQQESLTVEADENLMPYIQTEVGNGTLVLGYTREVRDKNVRPSKKIKFHLSMKEITKLDVSGAGDIDASSIDADSPEIVISGAGDINIASVTAKEKLLIHLSGAGNVNIESVNAEEVTIHLSGSGDVRIKSIDVKESLVHLDGAGDVELAGRVVEQGLVLNGVGNYRAAELQSETTTIEVNGVGNAMVWVTDALDVRIPGPGSVEYYGQPQVTKDVSITGRLVSLGNP